MKTIKPGWILMTKEVMRRFTLEDLNLSDRDLVDKYWESYTEKLPYNKLLPIALRLNITKTLTYERV